MTAFPINWLVGDDRILDEDRLTVRADGDQDADPDLPPGSASWSLNTKDEVVGLLFVCPCGCGSVGDLAVAPGYGGPVWHLTNGDYARPTLEPSVQKTSPCRWHGYVERGWWCNDRGEVPG